MDHDQRRQRDHVSAGFNISRWSLIFSGGGDISAFLCWLGEYCGILNRNIIEGSYFIIGLFL